MGLIYSEELVQERSGVLDSLQSLPRSEEFLDLGLKSQKIYSLWTRNTIPWKLSCENDPDERAGANSKHVVIDWVNE